MLFICCYYFLVVIFVILHPVDKLNVKRLVVSVNSEACCGACKEDLVRDQSKRQSADWSDVRQAGRMRGTEKRRMT